LFQAANSLAPPPDALIAAGGDFSQWKHHPFHNPDNTRAVLNPISWSGDQNIVLVDFADREGLFTGQDFHDAFFGDDEFPDYYRVASHDQLRYTGTVVGVKSGSIMENSNEVAYVRLPHPIKYYADGNRGFSVRNFPRNSMGVVYDAAQALEDAGFDFPPYADADNKVQNLVIVFAGIATVYTFNPRESLEATAYRISLTVEVRDHL